MTGRSSESARWRLAIGFRGGDFARLKSVFDHPHGIIVYDASGRMAVRQANLDDRKPFSKGPAAGTLEEKAAAFDSYGALLRHVYGRRQGGDHNASSKTA